MTSGVLVLAGPPCAGKSTVARVLVGRSLPTRTTYVEVDALFSLLLPGSDRNRDHRMLAYDAAHAVTRVLAERGRLPVLECTYARTPQRASLVAALADLPAVPLWVVELHVSPDVVARRFRERDDATDLDDALVRERAEHFPYSDHALRLDAEDATSEKVAGQIAVWLRQDPEPVPRDLWVAAGRGWD